MKKIKEFLIDIYEYLKYRKEIKEDYLLLKAKLLKINDIIDGYKYQKDNLTEAMDEIICTIKRVD